MAGWKTRKAELCSGITGVLLKIGVVHGALLKLDPAWKPSRKEKRAMQSLRNANTQIIHALEMCNHGL